MGSSAAKPPPRTDPPTRRPTRARSCACLRARSPTHTPGDGKPTTPRTAPRKAESSAPRPSRPVDRYLARPLPHRKARYPLRLLAQSGLRGPLLARRRPRPRPARGADYLGPLRPQPCQQSRALRPPPPTAKGDSATPSRPTRGKSGRGGGGAKIWGEDRGWEAALAIALTDRG